MYFLKCFLVIAFMELIIETRTFYKRTACHALCKLSVQWNVGACQENGRCLCRWGWTGPNGIYINVGNIKNLMLADYCTRPCHFTHSVRNRTCGFDLPPMTSLSTTKMPLFITPLIT